jgi:hypothetical protein
MSNIFAGKEKRTTSIVLTRETRDKLASCGGKDDTFESIIKRLIEEHIIFNKKYTLRQTADGVYYEKRKDGVEELK